MASSIGTSARTVTLANGSEVAAIGQGTWYLGDSHDTHDEEVLTLREGIARGMKLIDTAEMYGNGRSERLGGDALSGRMLVGAPQAPLDRDAVFLVSKVLPSNAGDPEIFRSCDGSLEALDTDRLDLYLLHWRGSVPLQETVECLEALVEQGKIGAWGVSNFDVDDMEELWRIPAGRNCQVNEVLYHPASRGIEYSLLPWMRDHDVALMAYCPLAQAGTLRRGLFSSPELAEVARRHGATIPQVILAWDIRDGHSIAIPKSSTPAHATENATAAHIELDSDDLALIGRAWPAPGHKVALDVQ